MQTIGYDLRQSKLSEKELCSMKIAFSHVNLVSRDWRALADFYIHVFDCIEKPPARDLNGPWVDRLTGLEDAHIQGIHLTLPGSSGQTLEIFSYQKRRQNQTKEINLEGFGHIAFAVENVQVCVERLLAHGGSLVGKVIDTDIEGVGHISVVYARDPEGNIIELQRWS